MITFLPDRRPFFGPWSPPFSLSFMGSLPDGATLTRDSAVATRVNSSGVMVIETADVARYTYNGATLALRGLLVEPERTNSFTKSEQFDDVAWTETRSVVVANADVAPDGATTMDKITEDASSGTHIITATPAAVTAGQVCTLSSFIKASERNWNYLTMPVTAFGANSRAFFDTTNGVVGAVSGAGHTAAIEAFDNSIWRCGGTMTAVSNGTTAAVIGLAAVNSATSYQGVLLSGLFAWGAQFEVGSGASSYIPTDTVAVTRAADVLTLSLASGMYREINIVRENGSTLISFVEVTDDSYIVPTSTSPLQRIEIYP